VLFGQGPSSEGQDDLLVPQEVVLFEVLEAEPWTARCVDLDATSRAGWAFHASGRANGTTSRPWPAFSPQSTCKSGSPAPAIVPIRRRDVPLTPAAAYLATLLSRLRRPLLT
jgi:hypothetical protein